MTTPSSTDAKYAERLRRKEGAWWKKVLDVQLPYRMHLRRLDLGFVLDVGCGIGRNLANLGVGNAVGVDPNPDAIATARERGFEAYTPDEFRQTSRATNASFDSILVSHVVEHMPPDVAQALVASYLDCLRPGGRVVLITPQEAGYRSDATHVEFVDLDKLAALTKGLGLSPESAYSFPFPRWAGRSFKYNEFVHIARKS